MSNKIKLNLGCGVAVKAGWINVDNYLTEEGFKSKEGFYKNAVWEEGGTFVKADILKMPFADNYADQVEMHEVIEHLKFRNVIPALKEVYRVMKKDATLILDAPCMDGLALDWIEMSMKKRHQFDLQKYIDVMETIVGNQYGDSDGEVHRTIFNYDFMNFCLNQAGFTNGVIAIYEKGMKTVDIGELSIAKPDQVWRNDVLVVTAIK